jgi:YgiT-type zinc finger domain-containing protein
MKCGICGHGRTRLGTTTVVLLKGGATVVFKDVPAEVCENCGERYLSEQVTSRLLKEVEQAAASGVQVEIRSFAA